MQRASLFALVAVALAVGVVVSRGSGLDAMGMGILGGAILGCVVALLSHSLVSMALHRETAEAFKFVGIGFMAKAVGAILPWGLLSFWAPAGAFANGTAYVIAYMVAVLIVLGAGVIDHVRLSATLCAAPSDGARSDGGASAAGGDLSPSHSPPVSGSSTPLESAS